jgi:hypothetical protein
MFVFRATPGRGQHGGRYEIPETLFVQRSRQATMTALAAATRYVDVHPAPIT